VCMNRAPWWAKLCVCASLAGPFTAMIWPTQAGVVLVVMGAAMLIGLALADERVVDVVTLAALFVPLLGLLFQTSDFARGCQGWVFGLGVGFWLAVSVRDLMKS
jgi:hypothetical protein